jgi:hypothetical protein
MPNRKEVVLAERLSSVIAKKVAGYMEANALERAGRGEQASLAREECDRWSQLERRIGNILQISSEAAA